VTGNDIALAGWLVGGVAFGLIGANMIWQDPGATGSPGLDAFMVFIVAIALAPFIAAGLVLAALAWSGAWLLPAFRERKRAERAERERVAEQVQRAEVDRLHVQLGLPSVDWEGRS
jgi:hypothetical protein